MYLAKKKKTIMAEIALTRNNLEHRRPRAHQRNLRLKHIHYLYQVMLGVGWETLLGGRWFSDDSGNGISWWI